MARRSRRGRLSGISVSQAEQVCDQFYRKDKAKADVCKKTARSLILKMVQNKPSICRKWCGCPG